MSRPCPNWLRELYEDGCLGMAALMVAWAMFCLGVFLLCTMPLWISSC